MSYPTTYITTNSNEIVQSLMYAHGGINNHNQALINPRKHPKLKSHILPIRQIENLPFPIIDKLANQLSANKAIPYDMVLHGILASASFCVQGVADVRVPGGWTSPTSGLFIVAAPSSAGKTPLDKAVFSVPSQLEDALLSKKLGDEFDADSNNRPLIFNDNTTGTAMTDNIVKVGSVGLINSEAAHSFAKLDIQAITAINTLHDGNELRLSRGGPNGYSKKIENVRLMCYLGIQDSTLDTILKDKNGKQWIDVGLFNRVILARPEIDFTQNQDDSGQNSFEALQVFQSRQAELLHQSYTPGNVRQLIEFDHEACEYWKELSVWLRSECAPGKYFHAVSGHAAKLRDIIPRIAAVIHVFEGFEGNITKKTLEAAFQIILHFADYHVAQFSPISQSTYDAEDILNVLHERFYSYNGTFISPEQRYIYLEAVKNILPSQLKKPDRLHDALITLSQQGLIGVCWLKAVNSNKRKRYIDLYPANAIYPPIGLIYDGRVM